MTKSPDNFDKLIQDIVKGEKTDISYPKDINKDQEKLFINALAQNNTVTYFNSFSVENTLENPVPLLQALTNKPDLGALYIPPFALTAFTATAFARTINSSPNLTGITLHFTEIEDGAGEMLCRSLAKNQKISRLSLKALKRDSNIFEEHTPNEINSNDLISLFKIIQQSNLREIEIKGIPVCDDSAKFLGSVLSSSKTLESINFTSSPMSVSAAGSIGQGVAANTSLDHFSIEDDPFFNFEMASLIAKGLSYNQTIESTYIRGTSIGDTGFLAVLDASIQNKTPRVIYCDRNHITDFGAHNLANRIKNHEIPANVRVSLTGNAITDRGVDAVLDAVTENPTLAGVSLWLKNPLQSQKNALKIEEVLNDEHAILGKSMITGMIEKMLKPLSDDLKSFSFEEEDGQLYFPYEDDLNDLIKALEELSPSIEKASERKLISSILNIVNTNKQRLLCQLKPNETTIQGIFSKMAGEEKGQVETLLKKADISVETPFFPDNELHKLSEDSTASALTDAFIEYANHHHYTLNDDARAGLLQNLTEVSTTPQPEEEGYSKYIKTIFDMAVERQSTRIVSQEIKDKEGLMEITRFDLNVFN